MKRVNKSDKVFAHAIYLKSWQLDWIDSNSDFKANTFFRSKLEEYIKLKNEVAKIGESETA